MSSPTFILFGSGPGIGLSVAQAFSQSSFSTAVLCARDATRLDNEKMQVEETAKQAGRYVSVHTFPMDLSNLDSLKATLKEIENSDPWGTSVLALYTIAQWAIPLLQKTGNVGNANATPAFLTTSSHLPEHPMPILLSLSLVKAAQQNLILSLHEAFGKEIHFGVIKVCGQVAKENARLNPTEIAKVAVKVYEQPRGAWEVLKVVQEAS